ncbi:hypothetical protein [Minisyncoccus archaeiphilus]|uniref:hypothetical protein n=1 Tax=Minisyncoccus archaeiphilus TaxID=3238481 RepID=UPI00399D39F0
MKKDILVVIAQIYLRDGFLEMGQGMAATHFTSSDGTCYNNTSSYTDPVSWHRIFIR